MNPTPQSPGSKFSLGSKINARALSKTLAISAALTLLFTLVLYASLSGRNPINRLAYGIVVSVVPALVAFFVVKFAKLLVSWRGAVLIYLLVFAVVVIIQAVLRTISL